MKTRIAFGNKITLKPDQPIIISGDPPMNIGMLRSDAGLDPSTQARLFDLVCGKILSTIEEKWVVDPEIYIAPVPTGIIIDMRSIPRDFLEFTEWKTTYNFNALKVNLKDAIGNACSKWLLESFSKMLQVTAVAVKERKNEF